MISLSLRFLGCRLFGFVASEILAPILSLLGSWVLWESLRWGGGYLIVGVLAISFWLITSFSNNFSLFLDCWMLRLLLTIFLAWFGHLQIQTGYRKIIYCLLLNQKLLLPFHFQSCNNIIFFSHFWVGVHLSPHLLHLFSFLYLVFDFIVFCPHVDMGGDILLLCAWWTKCLMLAWKASFVRCKVDLWLTRKLYFCTLGILSCLSNRFNIMHFDFNSYV